MQFSMTDPAIRRDRPWWVLESTHYVLLFDETARGMLSPAVFACQAERRLGVIASALGLRKDSGGRRYALGRRIPYFIHNPQVCRYGNVDVGGIDVPAGRPGTFYQHEEAHAVLGALTDSVPSLFNEGFASFAQSPWSQQNHRIALAGLQYGELAQLSDIVEFQPFWRNWKVRGGFVYPQAGSFVAYLLVSFGSAAFLELCRLFTEDDPRRKILQIFQRVFGASLPDVEEKWKSYLTDNSERFRLRARPKILGSTEPHWVKRTMNHIEKMAGGRTKASSRSPKNRG